MEEDLYRKISKIRCFFKQLICVQVVSPKIWAKFIIKSIYFGFSRLKRKYNIGRFSKKQFLKSKQKNLVPWLSNFIYGSTLESFAQFESKNEKERLFTLTL